MCNHKWRKVFEEFILCGSFPVGWECTECKEFVSLDSLTPAGLEGTVLKNSARLIAPHGGTSQTSEGNPYKEQIVDEDGNLSIK
jgi:hypothetical protein